MSSIATMSIYTYYLLARSLHVAPSMAFCIKMMGFITCSVYVSILSFAACALDQYVAIVHPFAYARLASNRLAVGSVVGIWLLSLVVGPPARRWAGAAATRPKCSIYEVVDAPYTILMVSVSYYMTAPLIISLYARTFVVARRHIKAISAQASALAVGGAQRPTQQPNVRKELDVAVTIFIAVVVFLISWFPFTTAVVRQQDRHWKGGIKYGLDWSDRNRQLFYNRLYHGIAL
ncbi:PREDICTED: glucose-dependent insulinotropic receptor-like [Priapulus caudatus]|uniref:Glucose-dependent insulinotropic receptor-like n=1 Tax=Priapulus caudatus TaxID=37621 RepID=A0ABM1E0P5_PRICU|nr:PREDICTED: glucose-dependent insulinotropic receptor-like [Priapulus caudatus]